MATSLGGLSVENTGELRVVDMAAHPGEDSTFDRTYGGRMPASKSALTATGAVGAAGVRKYHGYMVTTALSAAAITIYDNTSAAGTVIDIIPASTAAGTLSFPCDAPVVKNRASRRASAS